MKIKSKFTFQIDIQKQIDLYFYLHFVFYLLPQLIVISLYKFDLIKTLLFWNENLKSNGSDGPSWPIAAIIFCRTNINDTQSSALPLNHADN